MDVVELMPGLHLLEFPVGQVYLLTGPRDLPLIDTGYPGSAPAIAAAIRELGRDTGDVRRLLLTHCHEDHIGSAADVAAWGDVAVYAHRDDVPVIRGEATCPPPTLTAYWERALFDQVTGNAPAEPPKPVAVDHELSDGDELDLGGIRARALAVPGHTPGSVAFHLPDLRVLFTGDTIARAPDGRVMLGVFNIDPDTAAASMVRQQALDVDLVCFGHGKPLPGGWQ